MRLPPPSSAAARASWPSTESTTPRGRPSWPGGSAAAAWAERWQAELKVEWSATVDPVQNPEHREFDCAAMIAGWVAGSEPELVELGYDPQDVVTACDQVMDDLAEIWAPFTRRFAALALGQGDPPPDGGLPPGPYRALPLLGQ